MQAAAAATVITLISASLAYSAPALAADDHSGGAAFGTPAPAQTGPDPSSTGGVDSIPPPVPVPVVAAGATIAPSGMAIAPAGAPIPVQDIIAAGNQIARKPYVWGGGHRRWLARGYDCSGSVSFALHGAGLLSAPFVSGDFARWGDSGPGAWVTLYANAGHVFMVVAGLRFDTSGQRNSGTRWQPVQRRVTGFSVRHPAGL